VVTTVPGICRKTNTTDIRELRRVICWIDVLHKIFVILGEGKLPGDPFCDLLEFQFPLCGTVT
jgi:hypothetical protein